MNLEADGFLLRWKNKYWTGDPNKCKSRKTPHIKYTLKHLSELQIVSAYGLCAATVVLIVEIIWHFIFRLYRKYLTMINFAYS